jgi:uncharacterized repeat protein (TIGR01451 family)
MYTEGRRQKAEGRKQGPSDLGVRRLLLAAFCLLPSAFCLLPSAHGQVPVPHPAPHWAASPLLHVRFGGMAGLHATFYQGTPDGRDFPAPVAVGLRPGYIYRVRLSGLPGQPDRMLYPTLEVRGTLQLPPGLHSADYPAPVTFTPEEIDQVLSGAVLTKVVFLEDPNHALAEASRPDQPLEIDVAPGADPLDEARARGRPLIIVRLGERDVSREELARQSIPGTIKLPDQTVLPSAMSPPCIPWAGVPIYDPILGPRFPDEECLHDGGTRRAGIGPDGRPQGLEPSDTVAAYTDSQGRRSLAVSNRICLCVPRFVVMRGLTALVAYQTVLGTARTQRAEIQSQIQNRARIWEIQHNAQLQGFTGRERPSVIVVIQSAPQVVGQVEGIQVTGTVVEVHDVTSVPNVPPPPDKPLILCKWADAQAAQVGDVVTMYLKYSNHGGQPITGVAVADSLTGRLEYVPGSERSDRDAAFTTTPNEAGSATLRWEVRGPLPPGQSGLVSFRVRIR